MLTLNKQIIDTPPPTTKIPPPAPPGGRPSGQKRRTRNTTIVMGVVVLAIVAGVILYVRLHAGSSIGYLTVVVDRGDIESTVTTSGNLNAVTTVQVGSQVSGNITALYADFNTKVKKGQLVAEIDPAPFAAAVSQAIAVLNAAKASVLTAQSTEAKSQADLATAVANAASARANVVKAQAAADLAKLESDRRQNLVKTGSTSREDADTALSAWQQAVASVDAANAAVTAANDAVESARRQVDVAGHQLVQMQADVAQDEAALSQARLNLSHTKILAPVDGTVESRNMDVGQTVAASFQAPVIFLIAQDLTKMQVDTNVDESDVGHIQIGQEATFTVDAWPGRVFHGAVRQIRQAPINVQNVITYDVVIQVSNADLKLFPGMTANVAIAVSRSPNALRIPKSALRFRLRGQTAKQSVSSRQTVYVADSRGEPAAVQITTGIADASYVEILSGDLREGQRVIVGATGSTPATAPASPAQPAGRKMGF